MSSYRERPLGDVLALARQQVSVSADETYKIAGIYSFGRGLIRRPSIQGSETTYVKLSVLAPGQLVMSKLNAWEGALTIVPEDFAGFHVSPEYPVFDIDSDEADVAYLQHLVRWPQLWELLTPRGSMVRRKRTTPETLLTTRVPLPPLDEQRRVAARLSTMLAKTRKVTLLQSRLDEGRALFAEASVRSASATAKETARVGDILRLSREPVDIDPDRQYRPIGLRSFGRGIIRYPAASGSELSKLRYFTFPPGALALSNIKAWEGAISVTCEEDSSYVASNRFLFYLPTTADVDISYLRHYFLSRGGLPKISAASPGGADRNRTLGISRFGDLRIPLPPRNIQRETARAIDRLESLGGPRQESAVENLEGRLLHAAFTGRL